MLRMGSPDRGTSKCIGLEARHDIVQSRNLKFKFKELIYLYIQVDSCIITEIKNLKEYRFEIFRQEPNG